MEIELAAAFSHEVKGSLRGIEAMAQALLDDYTAKPLDEEGSCLVEHIRRLARDASGRVDALRDLSSTDLRHEAVAEVDLHVIAEEILSELERSDPGRYVLTRIEPDLSVRGDPRLLRVALANLITNAWKYTQRAPKARITIGRARAHDNGDAFFVADNGIGFDAGEAASLFRPFRRLAGAVAFDGTGLGLAIVAKIIKLHGGKIWAEGRSGLGATFWFTLPSAGEADVDPSGTKRLDTFDGPNPG